MIYLKELRKRFNLNQIDLADIVGVSRSTIAMWETGKSQPDNDIIIKLSEHFHVSIDFLFGREQKKESPYVKSDSLDNIPGIIRPRMKKVPLLGKTACGEPIYSPNFDDGFALVDESFEVDFALEAKGDSMTGAGINNGDIVYFKRQDSVDNGQIAAVFVDNEVTLKRVYYYKDKNKLVLQPENPAYEPLIYINEELDTIRIIGLAVAHLRRL